MTPEKLVEVFDLFDEEYLKFESVETKRNNRADLHAFLLLDELVPCVANIVAYATHDEIELEPSVAELAAAVVTTAQVLELVRCGVRCDGESLKMLT